MITRRWVLLAVLAVLGCSDDGDAQPEATPSATAAETAPAPSASTEAVDTSAWAACQKRIDAVKAKEALPGAPTFEKNRVHLARVRGQSLLWRRAPEAKPHLDAIREDNSKRYELVVRAFRRKFRKIKNKKERREYVLRDGYVWHPDVWMALAIVEQVSLPKLFEEKTVFIQRGVDIWKTTWEPRTKLHHERFVYAEGPYEGEKAEILLGDRVALSREELEKTPPLHIDLRDLMDRAAFDRIRPVHLTDDALVADLRYGPDVWVPALVELDGAKAKVACEAPTAELAEKRKAFVDETALLRKALGRLRQTVRAMVRDQIAFDADTGQTMGFLRKAWKRAYFNGWRKFNYEDELRTVYNEDGHPVPPQVCIDFLTDTWERASGTWYAAYDGDGKPIPKRVEGGIDFEKLDVENRRSVAEFTDFTIEHPDLFDVWAIPKDKRFRFLDREIFYDYLAEAADNFRPGDMITIHGYKEGGRPHYHSLMILEQDPITGVPTLVAGNAVFPREQTLEGVMQISPKRSLRHRIRVKEPWLKALAEAADAPVTPPPAKSPKGDDEKGDDEKGDDEKGDDEKGDDEKGDDEKGDDEEPE